MRKLAMAMIAMIGLGWSGVSAEEKEERVWDQAKAAKMVAKMVEVEGARKRPWNNIPWRTDVKKAITEARNSGKPILLFFYVPMKGPPLEPCCPGGRLMRTTALSDSAVQSLAKKYFIPLKIKLDPEKGFPVDWPAVKSWQTAFQFTEGKGFAGCSVVAADLHVEFANTGSAKVWEIFESTAYDAKKFAAMLKLASDRSTEDRALRAQRGINPAERQMVVGRFRQGVEKAVRTEGRGKLPPKGFSLELALELYEMAGLE